MGAGNFKPFTSRGDWGRETGLARGDAGAGSVRAGFDYDVSPANIPLRRGVDQRAGRLIYEPERRGRLIPV
mgnify:CR=1 FL=1